MMWKNSKFLYFIAATMILCNLCHCEDFHPDRTLLMDYYPHTSTPTNFLFRGNMPIINGTFAYHDILNTMTTIAEKHNFTIIKNSTIIIISYLNIFEYPDLKIEKDFFKSNPNLGRFYDRVITGSVEKPPENDTKLLKDTVKEHIEFSVDQLPTLMTFMRAQLTQPGPVVIYSHCEAGTDRTGEVSGAYYITYLNMSFAQALYIDNHVLNRDMETISRNGFQWYCFYLYFVKGYNNLNCII